MSFESQKGKGRPKGAKNKTPAILKDAILIAAEQAGNQVGSEGLVSYLQMQAKENPNAFLSLLGKVLPMQMEHSGPNGADLVPIINITRGA